MVYSFVCKGSGSGNDAYAAALVDKAGHDADFALSWGDDAGAIGPHEACFALGFQDVCYADHVVLGDAFCDADYEANLGFNGFFDACGC